MRKVCSSSQMRELEKRAEKIGIPPLILMENAAIGVANYLKEIIDVADKKILVLSGRGNNGGDGMAVARHLKNSSADVSVVIVDGEKSFSSESDINFKILNNMGIPIFLVRNNLESIDHLFDSADIIIDALFGTGLTREVSGIYRDLIFKINNSRKYVLSIDIPSGINSDTGEMMGIAVKANSTVTFGYLKLGHLLFPGREYAGDIRVVDISLSCDFDTTFFLIGEEERGILKRRGPNTHKGTYGHMVVIGGSKGKSGAVSMSAKAGLRTGAGLVTIVCPVELNNIIEACSLEVMTFPLQGSEGYLDVNSIDALKAFLEDKESIVLGPGMGFNDKTINFFENVMKIIQVPTVIDADGLNCLSIKKDLLKKVNTDIVLTPHPGEMARLMDVDIKQVLKSPVELTMEFAKKYSCHVILKGATTIYSDPSGNVYFSTYGNPGMATAGSGDVLSGIIGSLIAQKYSVRDSIILSLLLHGRSGDYAKECFGEYGLNATDIIEAIPMVLKKWEVNNGC
ncbi:MAG: NAD(P)H-hydrate dehydratase [Proteobacteria bacterium]|nr:NAD(P)H-hydrate dehydratase [Pseudomonadota bacterium]